MTAHTTNLTSIGLQPGDKLDKYEVGQQIGAGGLSVVWKAYDRLLNQTVAIKQLVLDSGVDEDAFRERFRREAEIQKKLSQANKNLVRVIDFVEDTRGLFIVMEYVDGPSLENLLSQNPGPVELKTALGIAAAAAVALGAIHKQGVVHRDLKPANILLPKDGGLKICDFGLASLIADQDTPAVGTVRYMSPELLNAEPGDARADMYSLGIILYEMLIGRQNFDDAFKIVLKDQRNQALRWMKWHTNAKVKAPPIKQYVASTPDPIAELVERMMEKDAGQRVGSMDQLIEAMRRQLAAPGSAAPAPGATATPTKTAVGDKTAALPKRNKLLIAVAAMVIFWTLVGIGYVVISGNKEAAKEDKVADAVRDDYRKATTAFRDARQTGDYSGAAILLRKVLADHPDHHSLKVGIHGDRPASLKAAVEGHLLFCDAKAAFEKKDYDKALELIFKASDADVVDPAVTLTLQRETEDRRTISANYDAIAKEKDAKNYFGAQAMLLEFRRSETYKKLSDADKALFDHLEIQIVAEREADEATKVIKEAENLAAVDRQKAIEHLQKWLEDKGTSNRTVQAVLDAYIAVQDFEITILQAKSAEQARNWAEAITKYDRCLTLNRLEAEKLGIPTRIHKIRGLVAMDKANEARAAGNIEDAFKFASEAKQWDPDLKEADAIIALYNDSEKIALLERQAVTAWANKEYERYINIWKDLGETYKQDPQKVADEIAKAEFQILKTNMENAWASGDEQAIIDACRKVLSADSGNERALLLQTLVNTRRRFYDQLAVGEREANKGNYGDSKLAIRRAREIAETISDAVIRDELVRIANTRASEVEYIDNFSKARRDFENGKFKEAKGWVSGALKEKKTDEAKALEVKIDAALAKQAIEKGL